MVNSILNPKINYPELKKLDPEDVNFDASMYEIMVLGQDIVKRRDADFLLRAVGVGLICAEEYEGRIKKAMGYWGTIANSISEAARINYVIENGLLDNPVDIKDVYYPMLREFCDNRGVYSGRNLSTSLYAMYGLGKLMRTENEPVLSFLLNLPSLFCYTHLWNERIRLNL